jgi:hypothetical protein
MAFSLGTGAKLLRASYEESSVILGKGDDLLFWNMEKVQSVRKVRMADPPKEIRSARWISADLSGSGVAHAYRSHYQRGGRVDLPSAEQS